ncbi:MAG: peptidase M48, partial [Dolichospermum sp.]
AQLSHPVPVLRAREVDRWGSSLEYQKIIENHSINDDHETVFSGGWRNW